MKPKPLFVFMFLVFTVHELNAQDDVTKNKRRLNELSFAFTNSYPALPFGKFSSLVTDNFHPGFEVATSLNWTTKPKHDWIQVFSFGYSYQRWVQHSLSLYTELGYRYKFPAGFSLNAKLGGGYMRAIVAAESFSDGVEDGKQYSKIVSGRSQAVGTFSLGVAKTIKSPIACRFFLDYQQRIQTPFIHSYVPMLPFNILKVGVAIPLKKKNKNQKS